MNINFLKGEIFQSEFDSVLEGMVYKNYSSFLIPVSNEDKTKLWQIDNLIISVKGIFCVELKSYTDLYQGRAGDLFIKSVHSGNKIKNPIYQNKRHKEALSNYIPRLDVRDICVVKGVKPDIPGETIYNMDEFIDLLIYSKKIYTISQLKEIDRFFGRLYKKYSTGKSYHY